MKDSEARLKKQAEWQKSRAEASWGEKIRQAEGVREGMASYCKSRAASPRKSKKS